MKIAVCSDLHLEFGPISLENTENAEVLILSGDICVAKDLGENDSYNIKGENDKSNQIHKFFQECCARFPSVIYIAGNHEHYHGDFIKSIGSIRDRLGYLVNLHVLDKESVLINNVLFIGGTLWTDMNKEDGITLMHMKSMMNDFRCVTNSARETYYRDDIISEMLKLVQLKKKVEKDVFLSNRLEDIKNLLLFRLKKQSKTIKIIDLDNEEELKRLEQLVNS